MRVFRPLYDWMLSAAARKRAPHMLGVISFAESVIFPIPTDVMLAPMVLARPDRWWRYALLTAITSVLGGICGYFLGKWAFEWITTWLLLSDSETLMQAHEMIGEYGVWVILVAAFTPIPYKVFTLTAGALDMSLLVFIGASAVGRSARFFLVAFVVWTVGARYEAWIRRWIEPIGWLIVATLVAVVILRGW